MGVELIAERLDDYEKQRTAAVTAEDVNTFRDLGAEKLDLWLDALDAGIPFHDVIGGAKRRSPRLH